MYAFPVGEYLKKSEQYFTGLQCFWR